MASIAIDQLITQLTDPFVATSGIIALIACGLMQAEYVKDNISVRSFTTIKYFTKTLSSIADVIIFYFLGRVLIRDDHVW